MNRPFWVDHFDIDTIDNFNVRRIVPTEMPQRIVSFLKKASDHGDFVTNADYGSRMLTVTGEISARSRELLDKARNDLGRRVNVSEVDIEFEHNGEIVKATGTYENSIMDDPIGGFMRVTLIFRLANPFYYAKRTITANAANQTAANPSLAIDNPGNIWAYCYVAIDIDSLTDNDSDTIQISGDSSNLLISRDFAAGEQIIIDPNDFTVTVDGNDVNYQGQFPKINPGEDSKIYISDTFSARQIDIALQLVPRYI